MNVYKLEISFLAKILNELFFRILTEKVFHFQCFFRNNYILRPFQLEPICGLVEKISDLRPTGYRMEITAHLLKLFS